MYCGVDERIQSKLRHCRQVQQAGARAWINVVAARHGVYPLWRSNITMKSNRHIHCAYVLLIEPPPLRREV